jgi:Raf kinase inhibitor-like YbhB/YbcL family protein
MRLISPAFSHCNFIPERYTCNGLNINPPLFIEDIPSKTKTFALLVDDPDSTYGYWVHWIVFNIPITSQIMEDSVPGKQGANSFNQKNYGGPCPQKGTHRYCFTVFALDTVLNLNEGASHDELEEAMQGHIIERAQIIGMFNKTDNRQIREKLPV